MRATHFILVPIALPGYLTMVMEWLSDNALLLTPDRLSGDFLVTFIRNGSNIQPSTIHPCATHSAYEAFLWVLVVRGKVHKS